MNRDDYKTVSKMLGKAQARMMGTVTRGKVTTSATGTQGQSLSVGLLQGETREGVEYAEPYGLAGAVPVGSTCLVFAVGGSRDHMVAVGASPKGDTPAGRLPGEVDVYSSVGGSRIRMHANGDISLLPGPTGVVYTGSDVNPLLPFVNGHGDLCAPSAAFTGWMTAVSLALADAGIVAAGSMAYVPPPPIPGAPIATTVATTTKTKVS